MSAKELTVDASNQLDSPERSNKYRKIQESPKGVDTLDISSASMEDFDFKSEAGQATDELSELLAASGIVDVTNIEATKTTQSAFDKKIRSGEDYLAFLGSHFNPVRTFTKDGQQTHTPLCDIPYSVKVDGVFVTETNTKTELPAAAYSKNLSMGLNAESKAMTAEEFAESADASSDNSFLPLAVAGEQVSEKKDMTNYDFSNMRSRDGACYLDFIGAHWSGIPNKPLVGIKYLDRDSEGFRETVYREPHPPVESKFSGLKYNCEMEGIPEIVFLPEYNLDNINSVVTELRTGKELFGLCADHWENVNRIEASDAWKKFIAQQESIPFDYENDYLRSEDLVAEKKISDQRFVYSDDNIKDVVLPLRDANVLGPSDPSYQRESLSEAEQCKRLWRMAKRMAARAYARDSSSNKKELRDSYFWRSLFFTRCLTKSSDDLALVLQLEAEGRLVKEQKDINYFFHGDQTTPLPGLERFRYWIETEDCLSVSDAIRSFAEANHIAGSWTIPCDHIAGSGYNAVVPEPEVESRMDNASYAAMIKAMCSGEDSAWGPSDPSYVRKERSKDSMRKRASTIFAQMSPDQLLRMAKVECSILATDPQKRALATNELKRSFLKWQQCYTTSLAQFDVLKNCGTKEAVEKVKQENPKNLFSAVEVEEEFEEDRAIRLFSWSDAMGISDEERDRLMSNFESRTNRCSVTSSGNPYLKTMARVEQKRSQSTTEEDKAQYNPDVFTTSCKEHLSRFLDAHTKHVKQMSAMIDANCNGIQSFKNKYMPEEWDPECYAARLHSDSLLYNSIKLRHMVENEIQMLRHEVYQYGYTNLYPELWVEDTEDCDGHAKMGAYKSAWLKADIDRKRAAIDARNIEFMQKSNSKMEKKYYKLAEKAGVPLDEDFVAKMEGRMKAKKFVANQLGMNHGFKYHRWHWGKMYKFVGNIVGQSTNSGCFNPDSDTAINIKEALHYTFLSPLQERLQFDYKLTRSTACHANEGCILQFDFVQKKIYIQVDAGDRRVNTYMDLPEFYASEAVAHAFCAEKEPLTFKWCGKNSSYLENDLDIAACEINTVDRAVPSLSHERLQVIETKAFQPCIKVFSADGNSRQMQSRIRYCESESDQTDNESDEESFAFSSEDYEGQRNLKGKPNGQGKVKATNSTLYEGSWFNGVRHTFQGEKPSVTLYQDGTKHVGCWKNDKKHGHGVEYAADGSVKYEGAYRHGVKMN